jgi:tol-pal system protein YbgF
MMKSRIFRLIAFFLSLVGGGCAPYHEVTRADSRISSLERRESDVERTRDQFQLRMEDFRKSQLEKDQQLRSQYAELYATVDKLQEQIQILNGKLEEKDFRQKQKNFGNGDSGDAALEQTINPIKDRLTRIEEYLAMDGGGKKAPLPPQKPTPDKPPVKDKVDTAPPVNELNENDLYGKAKQELDSGDLEVARSGFKDFLKRFPKSNVADSAQFWIGETYYRQKHYENAILEYQHVIENYPKGNKVPDALLKQGLSFIKLGDKSNGRLVLKELIKKYPSSEQAKIAKQQLEGP